MSATCSSGFPGPPNLVRNDHIGAFFLAKHFTLKDIGRLHPAIAEADCRSNNVLDRSLSFNVFHNSRLVE